MGSGIRLIEHAMTSSVAVSKDILCPTDTYTGFRASSEVRKAYNYILSSAQIYT